MIVLACAFLAASVIRSARTLGDALPSPVSVQLDLSSLFNAKAASSGVNDTLADFDGSGRAYPAEWLPTDGTFSWQGIEFTLPHFHDTEMDTVRTDGQTFNTSAVATCMADLRVHSLHALAVAVWPPSSYSQARAGNLTYTFDDGSAYESEIIVAPWYSDSPFDGPIYTPWHYSNSTLDYNSTIDHNITHISYVTCSVPNDKALVSITLPESNAYINFFAMTLLAESPPSSTPPLPLLSVQNVRSTTKWLESNDSTLQENNRIQQVEVLINNMAPLSSPIAQWITTNHTVSIESDSLEIIIPGRIARLRSNDQVLVSIGVRNKVGVVTGSNATVRVIITNENGTNVLLMGEDMEWPVIAGIPAWEENDASLATHESPEWFDDAKFGIFIHWGIFSVPAWAPTGVQYAEWYNWQLHNPPNESSPTWIHHLETYGPDVVYDHFIANFTASQWNPDDWTDLFADAGAKYFVLVTKHHEGFVMFDTNSTHRNSVEMGPKRDVVKELFTSAKSRHPKLRRGTYFSLPEWFNPAYAPYARTKFPGQPALNAFNNSCCDPYVGYIPVDDFIEQVQRPQMEALFYNYDTEILWCDADGRSVFPKIAAQWYNHAASQGRQVVRDNRCGSNQTDFVTPEYVTYGAQLSQKWESSAGLDPFSYGYNSDTPPSGYMNTSQVVTELVDIVSKGGNFLLDIGPKADGTIVTEMTTPLLQTGAWLKSSGKAIYGTRAWWIQSQDSVLTNVRFTTTTDAFYIIAVDRPTNGKLKTVAPVPIIPGDIITMLGGTGKPLDWSNDGGVLTIPVEDNELAMVDYAWAFKVIYKLTRL